MHDGSAQVDTSSGADLVHVPGNPPPDGAKIIWYEGRGGHRLRLLHAPAPGDARALVLVCPGRSEFIEKYFEVARELQERRFAVAIFDWPGQGLSQRPLRDPLRGHIPSFDWYVEALTRGVAALGEAGARRHIILAHSMGGAIALEAMRRREIAPSAAAFSAPMWGLPIWFFQRWYARLARLFGLGALPARPPQPPETFETNQLTHDETRWRLFRRLVEAEPRLALGEPTIAWVCASLDVFDALHRPLALAHLDGAPMLVAVATEETIVSKDAARKLASQLPSARLISVQGAGHEILMETDERRAVFWRAFDEMCERAGV